MDWQDYKEEFLEIVYDNIEREGCEALIEWLEKSDFFTAPASMRRHNVFEGGLCKHSINVYKRFLKLVQAEYGKEWERQISHESVAIIALFHDLCKVDFYKTDVKNVKRDGVWVQEPYYKMDEALPYGHGEKSVYILSAFMRLTREEALAINWHMGEYDARVKGGNTYSLQAVFSKYPNCFLAHCADLMTTYLDDVHYDN